MPILTVADYPAIRATIDVTFSKTDLPDDVIKLDIYSGAADDDVISRVSDAESKTGDDAKKVKRAAILFCAARLIPAVFQAESVTTNTRDLNYSKPTFDPVKRKAELIEMAEDQLADMADRTDPDNALTAGVISMGFAQKGDD